LRIYFISVILLFSGCASFYQTFDIENENPTWLRRIPNRKSTAVKGSQFAQSISALSGNTRETRILREILGGNLPPHLLKLKRVTLKHGKHSADIYVMPDYLSVGDDNDFFRVPITPMTATNIANRFGFILPTTKMVDAIYQSAILKHKPKPLPPGPDMVNTPQFIKHNQMIGFHRNEGISAGHKKDVVITNRLSSQPLRVAIYGWHRKVGSPIQPLSLVHGRDYVDYSHGVRLIRNVVTINGKNLRLTDAMRDSRYTGLFSHEGTVQVIMYPDVRLSSLPVISTTTQYAMGPIDLLP
jgi:hypothetical protein